MYRAEVWMFDEWAVPDDERDCCRATFEAADQLLAEAQVAILEAFGDSVEGRLVDVDTGAVVHEHIGPWRVGDLN